MSTRRKTILALALVLAALLATLVIVVPRLVDIDRYRPTVIAQIERRTGKKSEIGHLSLSAFPILAIRVDDFALANPEGFPQGNLLTARRIYCEVDAAALWHRQVVIKALGFEQPVLQLLSDARGRRNFDSPARSQGLERSAPNRFARVSLQTWPSFTLGVISKISISDGRLTDATLLPSGESGPVFFAADGIAAQLEGVDLDMFSGSSTAEPSASAISSLNQRTSTWEHGLAYAAAPSPENAGQGTFKAEHLRFGDLQSTSAKSKLRLGRWQVVFEGVSLDLYAGHAQGDLRFDFSKPLTRYTVQAQLRDVDVARLLAEFPQARGKMTGKMEGNLTLEGEITHSEDPMAGKRGRGHLIVRNGQLPTLRLNSNLLLLAQVSDVGPASGDPSSFTSITADLDLTDARLASRSVKVDGNGVDIDAAGAITLRGDGPLAYEGTAEVRAGQNAFTNVLAGLSGAKYANGTLSFPFILGGTLETPRFRLKPLGVPTGAGAVNPDAIQGIIDLFTKQPRKPQP